MPAPIDAVVSRALARFLMLPGVRRVGVALVEGGGRRLLFTASDRDHTAGVDWCFIDAYDDVPLTSVVRTGVPIMAAIDGLDARFAVLAARQREQSVAALAVVPLLVGGAAIGGVVLSYEREQPFDPAQRDRLLTGAGLLADEVRSVQVRMPAAPSDGAGHDAGSDAGSDPGSDPGSEAVQVDRLEVGADPQAVSPARRFVRRRLTEWGAGDDLVDTAVLCVSELVTNAVIHTGSPSLVVVRLAGDVVTVTVRDHGAESPEASEATGRDPIAGGDRADPLEVHGRGLQLVEALATRWGSELDAVGTTVWFELALTG